MSDLAASKREPVAGAIRAVFSDGVQPANDESGLHRRGPGIAETIRRRARQIIAHASEASAAND